MYNLGLLLILAISNNFHELFLRIPSEQHWCCHTGTIPPCTSKVAPKLNNWKLWALTPSNQLGHFHCSHLLQQNAPHPQESDLSVWMTASVATPAADWADSIPHTYVKTCADLSRILCSTLWSDLEQPQTSCTQMWPGYTTFAACWRRHKNLTFGGTYFSCATIAGLRLESSLAYPQQMSFHLNCI